MSRSFFDFSCGIMYNSHKIISSKVLSKGPTENYVLGSRDFFFMFLPRYSHNKFMHRQVFCEYLGSPQFYIIRYLYERVIEDAYLTLISSTMLSFFSHCIFSC